MKIYGFHTVYICLLLVLRKKENRTENLTCTCLHASGRMAERSETNITNLPPKIKKRNEIQQCVITWIAPKFIWSLSSRLSNSYKKKKKIGREKNVSKHIHAVQTMCLVKLSARFKKPDQLRIVGC